MQIIALALLISSAPATGMVEGRLGYPSCLGAPVGTQVCAESVDGKTTTCTTQLERVADGTSYALELPAGLYRVYAQAPGAPQRAYYSRAVTCGLWTTCDDHRPYVVEVAPGAHLTDVDPADWFAPPDRVQDVM